MQNKFQAKLENILTNNKSFLLFREPNSDFVDLWADQKFESKNKFIFNRFDNSQQIIINDDDIESIQIEKLKNELDLNLESNFTQEAISYESYIALLQNTVKELNQTNTDKIVISRIKEISNKGVNIIKTFKALHLHYPNAYLYLWYSINDGLWIGASPELLLQEEDLSIKTVSLAGTLPKNEQWSNKEILEQKVVTDYIISKLENTTNLHVDGPHTIDAGFFNHLKSYISADVKSYDQVNTILQKLHPTPAVCGMPQQDAQNFILKNEGYDRKFYAGYFGYKREKKSLYFVNLRCAQIFKNTVKLYVGGGIMPNSNPQKEWDETELKSKTIGNLLVTD